MPSVKTLYAVVAILAGLLVVSSSISMLYYTQYQQQAAATSNYLKEVNDALSAYNSLAAKYHLATANLTQASAGLNYTEYSFQALASLYNRSLSLLSSAVSSLNTSSQAYVSGSRQLSTLWSSYLQLLRSYRSELASLRVSPVRAGLSSPLAYYTNILVDFGNGTRTWYNETAVQPGWNLYVATLVLFKGDVQATWYPQYQEHFVYGIGGVANSASQNRAWFLWTWNASASWQMAQVGADQLTVYNDSVFAWTYCQYNPTTYSPSCSPR
jgi:type II secretory pathway pseudopilin PulG